MQGMEHGGHVDRRQFGWHPSALTCVELGGRGGQANGDRYWVPRNGRTTHGDHTHTRRRLTTTVCVPLKMAECPTGHRTRTDWPHLDETEPVVICKSLRHVTLCYWPGVLRVCLLLYQRVVQKKDEQLAPSSVANHINTNLHTQFQWYIAYGALWFWTMHLLS